jgi:hypothetical protein
MSHDEQSAGDSIPSNCVQIEVHVTELKQLFNAIDPSPFRKRDLDPAAEQFIVGWAREARRDAPLALLVRLDRSAGLPQEPAELRDAVRDYFSYRARITRQQLRMLFRRGRISLLIGLVAMAAAILISDMIGNALHGQHLGEILRESFAIGGWVAMWRPLEVFLYDWWPIVAEARLYDRLAAMPVKIQYRPGAAEAGAWQSDWPAIPANEKPAPQRTAIAHAGSDPSTSSHVT